MPHAAIEVCRQRLTPAAFERAVLLAEIFSPETAVDAGFLDAVVPQGELLATAHAKAAALRGLDLAALATTKARARAATLAALAAAMEMDARDLAGVR
jgi:enoyl-CoA hydratase